MTLYNLYLKIAISLRPVGGLKLKVRAGEVVQ